MRVVVTSEYHFLRGPDGIYTDSVYPYSFWTTLHDVFEDVCILARVRQLALPASSMRVDGPGVTVAAVPDFTGAAGVARSLVRLLSNAGSVEREADAFLLRAPGVMSSALREILRVRHRPYGIAVVGDPRESLRAGDRVMRAMTDLASWYLREQVWNASASRFVTERALQDRYPPRPGTFTVAVSDLHLPDEVLERSPAVIRNRRTLALAFIGSLERNYKGLDVLLDALTRTAHAHHLDVVGDGALRASLEQLARRLGLGDRVRFIGRLPPGAPVFDFLATHDLLVMPSRTEGMPRVLIEAMGVGLPALATPVGGVPELIDVDQQVPVDDPATLARSIDRLAESYEERQRLAVRNRDRARDHRASVMTRKLDSFHRAVRDVSHK